MNKKLNKGIRTLAALSLALMTTITMYTGVNAESATTVTTTSTSVASQSDDSVYGTSTTKITLDDTIVIFGNGAAVATDGTTVNITKGGTYIITGEIADGQIVINTTEKVKLVLNGASITNTEGPAILVKDADAFKLELAEGTENTLADLEYLNSMDAAVYSADSIIIDGEGSLTVEGNDTNGIYSEGSVTIDGGSIRVTAPGAAVKAVGDVTVNSGYTYLKGRYYGIDSDASINMNGGKLIALSSDYADSYGTIASGLNADAELVIKGGTLIATGKSIMTPDSTSTQSSVYLQLGTSIMDGTLIELQDKDGSEVVTFDPQTSYSNLLYSSNEIASETRYNAYLCADSDGTEVDGVYKAGSTITLASNGVYQLTSSAAAVSAE